LRALAFPIVGNWHKPLKMENWQRNFNKTSQTSNQRKQNRNFATSLMTFGSLLLKKFVLSISNEFQDNLALKKNYIQLTTVIEH